MTSHVSPAHLTRPDDRGAGVLDASVVIPLGGYTDDITRQLEALKAQEFSGWFEIIVAANCTLAPSDSTAIERLLRAGDRIVDASAWPGPGYARNLGAGLALGGIVAFCDSDDIVAPEWLKAHVDALAMADISLGVIDKEALNSSTVQHWNRSMPSKPDVIRGFRLSGPSANLAVRRDVFMQLGGFDHRAFPRAGEDVDFCWRAQREQARVVVTTRAVVHYRLRPDLRSSFSQSFSYARAEAALYARYQEEGMERTPLRRLARDCAWLAKHAPGAAVKRSTRGEWVKSLALRLGRLAGSWENRVWYP